MNSDASVSLGICIGASTISAVWLLKSSAQIELMRKEKLIHHGNPKSKLTALLGSDNKTPVAVTGRKFRSIVNLSSISEPEAIELAYKHLNYNADIIISAGGENFIVYDIDPGGKISRPYTGNKCASGTGEFFLQQIKRMDLDTNDAVSLALKGEAYNISGRCSVFCKSDCTHALNKGTNKADVAAGLTNMMAQKIIELTSKSEHRNALLIGGVSNNRAVINYLENHFNKMIIPDESDYFEAYGAALYALENETRSYNEDTLIKKNESSFTFYDGLKTYSSMVSFKSFEKGRALENDEVVLGLDVGSTTTKAVLIRREDDSIIASVYLRTNGDPVAASIECYKELKKQLSVPVNIIGLGVTGSGRYIAGLHAQSKGIINEIIAHAAATVYFDPEADTIFEIGGQDAKYTYITAGVASDYAMNEACSAGTGSFLEESAHETLNINYKKIGDIALQAERAPNFNDQCSAFISSDIKNALHEGLTKEEIVAGLVYSVCLNYTNRVKGSRPVGKKVFMQGGVCYNRAVPVAMAALTGKQIIVPPEPGLMGAFGVALEIKKRLQLNILAKKSFNLDELISRKVEYDKNFVCAGGAEKCDRKCSISLITVNNKKYPFGGACNKYYNLQVNDRERSDGKNLVQIRQELVFEKYIHPVDIPEDARTVGIPKSFLTNTYYPLYYNFFRQLGFDITLGDEALKKGIDRKQAAFCYPAELAHGFIQDLIDKEPDFIFMPHIVELNNDNSDFRDKTCVLLQAESYYLKSSFKNELKNQKILAPVLDFSKGFVSAREKMVEMAGDLGVSKPDAYASFDFALNELKEMLNEFRSIGKRELELLEKDKDKFAVILVGRAYNSYAKEANAGIPQKFSSRNVTIIPQDFLPYGNESIIDHMYWGMGNQILKAGKFIKNHDQLYAAYITNFSCGPDSFLIGYFRDIMENKPSLTLELDSHSADAGINTRIEAFLDIVKCSREIENEEEDEFKDDDFNPMEIIDGTIKDSDGNTVSINDASVKMIVPNMGRFAAESFSAAFRHCGINSEPLPVYTYDTVKTGRGSTTCKECLPLILTTGSMLDYYKKQKDPGEKTLFFMAGGDGPCRFGQYSVFLRELIRRQKLKNMGVFTLSDDNLYEGLGDDFDRRGYTALLTGDVFQNIYHAINTMAADKEDAIKVFEREWNSIIVALETKDQNELYDQLKLSAGNLSKIKREFDYENLPKVAVIGEIFVRNDEFSRVDLMNKLYENRIIPRVAPVTEYVHYSNYMIDKGFTTETYTLKEKLRFRIRKFVQMRIEKKIRSIMAGSGFCDDEITDVDEIIKRSERLIDPELAGEAILTVGSALYEVITNVSGVISLGPFGCMPSRVAESILNSEMNAEGKVAAEKRGIEISEEINDLPYLAIETDGNLYPQIIQSKIEIFILQTGRLHRELSKAGEKERLLQLIKFKKRFEDTLKGYYEELPETFFDGDENIVHENE